MNITLVSYARSLDFGIVACRRSLPEIQRMIDYLEESLVELEEVSGLASPRRGSRATKPPAKPKSKSKTQAKVKRKTKARAPSGAKRSRTQGA